MAPDYLSIDRVKSAERIERDIETLAGPDYTTSSEAIPCSLGGTGSPGRPLLSQTWVTFGLRTIQKAKAGIDSWPSLAFRKVACARSMMK